MSRLVYTLALGPPGIRGLDRPPQTYAAYVAIRAQEPKAARLYPEVIGMAAVTTAAAARAAWPFLYKR